MNERELAAGLAPTSSYRYADVVGNRLFVAGQVPMDGDRNLVGADDVGTQAQQCLDNLLTLVALHGFASEHIHQLTIYVVGPHQNLIETWRQVTTHFDGNVPPATLLGVTALGHHGQLVEIDAHVERAT
jgi:enamine deaminase RidA (YjgF/YER057c/UK114 family)